MSLQPLTIKILRKVKKAITNEDATVGFNMCVVEQPADSYQPDRSRARTPCGTVRCIGGWMLALVEKERPHYNNLTETVLKVFNEDPEKASNFKDLFFGYDCEPIWKDLQDVTVDQALFAIGQFIETDGRHAWVGADTDLPHNLILDLRKVQTILREGHPEHGFNMAYYESRIDIHTPDRSPAKHTCGTAFCIGGWLAHLNRLRIGDGFIQQLLDYYGAEDSNLSSLGSPHASNLSSLGSPHASNLYRLGSPCASNLYRLCNPRNADDLWRDIPAEDAIAAIDRFIETGGEQSW